MGSFWTYVVSNERKLKASQTARREFWTAASQALDEELNQSGTWQRWQLTESRDGLCELLLAIRGRDTRYTPLKETCIDPPQILVETSERDFTDILRATAPIDVVTFLWVTMDGGNYRFHQPSNPQERLIDLVRQGLAITADMPDSGRPIDGAAICFVENQFRLRIYPFPSNWRNIVDREK